LKILSVIGARPQIIKAAALSRAVRLSFGEQIEDVILHTGQHYDAAMSDVFFSEMEIPPPKYNLGIGSGSHGRQTALMMEGIEKVLLEERPRFLVVYGDTNSTLAAAVAAVKHHIPVAHIEAGLRSFNKAMPEEINRIVCDHCSTLLFSPTGKGIENLIREGFSPASTSPFSADHPGIFHTGDVMYDNSRFYARKAEKQSQILNRYSLKEGSFHLVTIHRDFNTDNAENLNGIFNAISEISGRTDDRFVIPLHPRTSKIMAGALEKNLYKKITENERIVITEPVSFFDMIRLEQSCSMVFTDSGGVQKEAFFFQKPCVILRPETEWVELVDNGNAVLTGAESAKIIASYEHFLKNMSQLTFPDIYGNGNAAEEICRILLNEDS
jgi:UDP-GlcNAc3NAcA epimerase